MAIEPKAEKSHAVSYPHDLYIENLTKPEADWIEGIRPIIARSNKKQPGSPPRSTVGTTHRYL
ncbi:hypothetical protein [Candidatus Neptunochlamydia vexilliferae]|uniref:Uncharacterized protein n=1 Tax=Candidatus Neptunichlamydia vexilliferae TaxID=1651774 RepID=A0ABS0AYX7_9BACT|nr:hypothetical protein [Candidatus Neptunochlamydia vexilliferae]MBF5059338.1 hypothetical protein [Candidatus Neptunochlamydia vexilliferae]